MLENKGGVAGILINSNITGADIHIVSLAHSIRGGKLIYMLLSIRGNVPHGIAGKAKIDIAVITGNSTIPCCTIISI